jgi:hypothetical protein
MELENINLQSESLLSGKFIL